ncbi:MAG: DUF1801 domain-containing protein [Bacteroidota bacterium]
MQYDVNSPAEYLAQLEKDWRYHTLEELRSIIKTKAPNLKEGIHYKMLGYEDERGLVFSLNAQKNFVSLYFGDIKKIDPDGSMLKGLNCGKGCIRFKKTNVIAETQIDQFIAKALSMWKAGKDIGC